jgi:hypothetical protein
MLGGHYHSTAVLAAVALSKSAPLSSSVRDCTKSTVTYRGYSSALSKHPVLLRRLFSPPILGYGSWQPRKAGPTVCCVLASITGADAVVRIPFHSGSDRNPRGEYSSGLVTFYGDRSMMILDEPFRQSVT